MKVIFQLDSQGIAQLSIYKISLNELDSVSIKHTMITYYQSISK